MPSNFPAPKKLSIIIFFIDIVCFCVYNQWFFQNIKKGWRKTFKMILLPQFCQNDKIYKKDPFFFNILKESLLVLREKIRGKVGYSTSRSWKVWRRGIKRVPWLLAAKSIFCWCFTWMLWVFNSLSSMTSLWSSL